MPPSSIPAEPSAAPANLLRLLNMRWLAVAAYVAGIAAAKPLLDVSLPYLPMLGVVSLLAAFNALTLLRVRQASRVGEGEVFAQLMVDVTALTVLLFFSGGPANPFVSLYLPWIAVAAAILAVRLAWLVAALCLAGYSFVIVSNVPLVLPDFERATRFHILGMWLVFVASGALMAWFIARMTGEVRRRDRDLAKAREAALRNERVVALGSLAAGAAHELGTPLATMAVLAGELARRDDVPADVREDLALLRDQVAQCKSIITGLAGRAGQLRAEGGRAQPVDRWVEEIVARWRALRPQAEARVALDGPRPAPLVAGAATLEQA